jgi:hypothetical protein
MLTPTRFHALLAGLALLALTSKAPAPPAPSGGVQVEKFLPDDADFVLVVNVKQALATPAFTKHYQKQVETLLKMDPVQAVLKGSGLDPLEDVERIIVAVGPSSHPTDRPGGGPFIIVEGRFDRAKLQARADELAKQFPAFLKTTTLGDAKVYSIGDRNDTMFAAALSDSVIGLAPGKDLLGDMLSKAAGTKKTALKNATLPRLLAKLDPKDVVCGAAAGEMIAGSSYSSTDDGMGNRQTKVTHHRLADQGIASIVGGLTVGDDVKGKVTITAKDEAAGAKLAGQIKDGLEHIIKDGAREVERHKEIAPLLEAFKTVQVKSSGTTITLEGKAGVDVLANLPEWFFLGVSSERAPVAVPDKPPPEKKP